MTDSVDRTLGEHSASLEALTKDVAEIKADVRKLVAGENQREGAKKTVYAIAAVISAVSGTVAAKFLK